MHRLLVAASLVAISAMVAYAAVPLGVSSRVSGAPRLEAQTAAVRPQATGTISGVVRDAQGTALAAAVVDAAHAASGWRALTLTDREGRFRIERAPTGEVSLTIRRGSLERLHAVQVTAGRTTVATLTMTAGRPPELASMPTAPFYRNQLPRMASEAGGVSHAAKPIGVVPPGSMPPPLSMESYARIDPSGYRRVADAPLSTFSVDVDTASYSNARRFLVEGEMPPVDAVRVEEWINYFPYAYPSPEGDDAFRVSTVLTACPWNASHQLLRVGVRGRALPRTSAPARNLVFLVDVSGSMMSRDKLPLVQSSLRMLTDQLTERDRIALVVYAGRTGVVLPSTPGDQQVRIHDAIARLEAGGSTNGAGGIQLAYRAARDGFITGGVNRVVLATDGDFNVGVTSPGELTRRIEQERASGVFLSVLGVGRGNLKDATLEALAERGNGNYAYVDSLQEARRVLVEQVGATLVTIARDVKLQVEFNPRHVGAYRLIGYENRVLQTEDFADDRKDAGEIGAGHTVTALYEIVPPGEAGQLPGATPLRYQQTPAPGRDHGEELATVSVRHKRPDQGASVLQSHTVAARVTAADTETAFASAVAEAALVLRHDPLATGASLPAATRRAEGALGRDPGGWRAEFVRLAHLATSLQSFQPPRRQESSEP